MGKACQRGGGSATMTAVQHYQGFWFFFGGFSPA